MLFRAQHGELLVKQQQVVVVGVFGLEGQLAGAAPGHASHARVDAGMQPAAGLAAVHAAVGAHGQAVHVHLVRTHAAWQQAAAGALELHLRQQLQLFSHQPPHVGQEGLHLVWHHAPRRRRLLGHGAVAAVPLFDTAFVVLPVALKLQRRGHTLHRRQIAPGDLLLTVHPNLGIDARDAVVQHAARPRGVQQRRHTLGQRLGFAGQLLGPPQDFGPGGAQA